MAGHRQVPQMKIAIAKYTLWSAPCHPLSLLSRWVDCACRLRITPASVAPISRYAVSSRILRVLAHERIGPQDGVVAISKLLRRGIDQSFHPPLT